jgi:hypothetical protein
MSDEDVKGDPNPTRLMERVMDKLDGVLFAHGFEFADETKWSEAVQVMERYIFHFYTDLTGGDEDYDPKRPADLDSSNSGGEAEVEGDEEEEEECEEIEDEDEDDADEAEPEPKKVKTGDDGAQAQP